MGLGDFVLAAGQAKLIHQRTGKMVAIGNGCNIARNELYGHIPYLINPNKSRKGFEWLLDWPGHRDYISHKDREPDGTKILRFNYKYKAEPAIIEVEPFPNDYIIIEPEIKSGAPPAKKWHHYQEVVDAFPHQKFLQFNMPTLEGTEVVKTRVVQAAQWIAGCRAYVGTEGFLHHLAAAFGKPAVVLFGAYAPPEVLGYDFHKNIVWKDDRELGHRARRGAMENIAPGTVIEALREYCRLRPKRGGVENPGNNNDEEKAG
jgi:hypothetical protein